MRIGAAGAVAATVETAASRSITSANGVEAGVRVVVAAGVASEVDETVVRAAAPAIPVANGVALVAVVAAAVTRAENLAPNRPRPEGRV